MTTKKKKQDRQAQETEIDQKVASTGESLDHLDAQDYVFDGPFDAQKAIEALCELNHERVRCARIWEDAKTEAANAKKALDDATNAITLLIDRIDAEQRGEASGQPALKTVNGSARATESEVSPS